MASAPPTTPPRIVYSHGQRTAYTVILLQGTDLVECAAARMHLPRMPLLRASVTSLRPRASLLPRAGRSMCSLPLHKRVEVAAARGDLDECRRLLAHDPRSMPSVVQEVERARATGARRLASQLVGALCGYWLWNAVAWSFAYRVLGAEAERLLAERDFHGSVELELRMKSFSPRCEIRAPDERSPQSPPLEPPMFSSTTGPLDSAATEPPAPAESPWTPPVEPRRVLVLPLVHLSALWSGRGEYSVWCRKSKHASEFRRPAPIKSGPPNGRKGSQWPPAS